MRKECSQLFSVLIISNVEEMVGLWVNASPAAPWGGGRRDGCWWTGGSIARGKRVDEKELREIGRRERELRTSRDLKVGRGAV